MALTLKALRQAVGKELHECVTGMATSGTAYSLTDTALIDPDESSSRLDRSWVRLFSSYGLQSETRRVRQTDPDGSWTGYDPQSGTLTWSNAITTPVAAGDEYEIHTLLDPEDLDRLIDRGLSRCYYLDYVDLPLVGNQREYDLSIYPWLMRKEQVVEVFVLYGETGERRQLPVEWFEVTEDEGTLTLLVRPYTLTGSYLRVQCLHPYGTGIWDEYGITCPLDWAIPAVLVEVYQYLRRHSPAQDTERYKEAQLEAAAEFSRKCYQYQPRVNRRIQHKDSPFGVDSSTVVR